MLNKMQSVFLRILSTRALSRLPLSLKVHFIVAAVYSFRSLSNSLFSTSSSSRVSLSSLSWSSFFVVVACDLSARSSVGRCSVSETNERTKGMNDRHYEVNFKRQRQRAERSSRENTQKDGLHFVQHDVRLDNSRRSVFNRL